MHKQIAGAFGGRAKIPQAILIEGGTPGERRDAALWAAACLVCEGGEPPCGRCAKCESVRTLSHPSIFMLNDDEGEIKIDAVRKIREEVSLRGFSKGKRGVVVHPGEKVNRNAANALLRILEEPPPDVHFIVTAGNRSFLPPTIVSRCTVFRIPPVPLDFFSRVEGDPPLTASYLLDALAEGNVRKIDELTRVFKREGEDDAVDRGIALVKVVVLALLELSLGSNRGIIELKCDEGKARRLALSPSALRETYDRISSLEGVRIGTDKAFLVKTALLSLMTR